MTPLADQNHGRGRIWSASRVLKPNTSQTIISRKKQTKFDFIGKTYNWTNDPMQKFTIIT